MPLTILLRCRDVEETREFYQSALGFNVRDTADGTLTAEYHGGVLIFTSGDLWETPLGFSGTIYFTVPDADGYFAAVKDKVAIAWPIQNMSYGSREFGVRDCNDYYLAFRRQA
jgi:catechol 2,3-dioxygenase-like lactoylglutathione lyase family enzyme